MSELSAKDLKRAILEVLNSQAQANKVNLLGRGDFQQGELESHVKREFNADDRARAAQAFEKLRTDGYLQATHKDLADPENWVAITSLGREFLSRDLKDYIDLALERISPGLVELRQGMWDAVERTSPDASRQAAHSARELLNQLLKEGAPAESKTRKERVRFLMQRNRANQTISKTDLGIIEANCDLVEAEHTRLASSSHSRNSVRGEDVIPSLDAVERILNLIFRTD